MSQAPCPRHRSPLATSEQRRITRLLFLPPGATMVFSLSATPCTFDLRSDHEALSGTKADRVCQRRTSCALSEHAEPLFSAESVCAGAGQRVCKLGADGSARHAAPACWSRGSHHSLPPREPLDSLSFVMVHHDQR